MQLKEAPGGSLPLRRAGEGEVQQGISLVVDKTGRLGTDVTCALGGGGWG